MIGKSYHHKTKRKKNTSRRIKRHRHVLSDYQQLVGQLLVSLSLFCITVASTEA